MAGIEILSSPQVEAPQAEKYEAARREVAGLAREALAISPEERTARIKEWRARRRLTEIAQLGQIEGVDADWRFLPCNGARKSGWPRAGRMLGAAIAKMQADAPILRPDAPIPLQPVL